MSNSHRTMDAKKAARKANAMKMNVTKVKPVVVKHVLDEQVMSIYDIKTHMAQQAGTSLQSQYRDNGHGSDQLSAGGDLSVVFGTQHRPEAAKDLLKQLNSGMQGLAHLQKWKENADPQIQRDAAASLAAIRGARFSTNTLPQGHPTDGIDYAQKSVRSDQTYNQSAIGEMGHDELDQLKAKNAERIRQIEERYQLKRTDIKSYKEIMIEIKQNWETKEQFKDCSQSYPTYGRGLTPNINMNSFMLQETMTGHKKSTGGEHSPQASVQAKTRRKILSPKRQRFENYFERYMQGKYIEQPLKEIPEKEKELEAPPPFDTVTKAEETHNAKVAYHREVQQLLKQKQAMQGQQRSLPVIEKEAQELINQENVVNLSQQWIEGLLRIYNQSKAKGEEHLDKVDKEEFMTNIVEDAYFEPNLETVVRVSVDGEQETLDALLFRIHQDKTLKSADITWDRFLGYFCRRGQIRENEKLNFSGEMFNIDLESTQAFSGRWEEADLEAERIQLERGLKETFVKKQNLVLKGGKGKYDITVPVPFDFIKHPREGTTIRQAWLEEEIYKREKAEERNSRKNFRANAIPRSTSQPLYRKIQRNDTLRREKNKEASMARTKATQKPFSFHERDLQAQRERLQNMDDIDRSMLTQFRARIVPWRILVPRFQMMMERDEHEREQRIQRNAEKSYMAAKLPPRMQQHEDDARLRKEEDLDSTKPSVSTDIGFDFHPPRARSVPDFRKLQKQFVTQMEARKKAVALTQTVPFKFHQPKPSAKLRTYMDQANQVINPTMKKKQLPRGGKNSPTRDQNAEQPATTKKHEAYVEKRRTQMETKKADQEGKFKTEIDRFIKQNRLKQRVKCSPALVSNAATLKKRREESLMRAKDNMKNLENVYDNIKANIEFNVANRPLLVEQVSNAFIHNLNQIKELQRYVTILREAGLNPDEHLTDEQRELLVSAEYYDRLNAATAYFPSHTQNQGANGEQEEIEEMDEEQENDVGEGELGEGEEDQDELQAQQQLMLQQMAAAQSGEDIHHDAIEEQMDEEVDMEEGEEGLEDDEELDHGEMEDENEILQEEQQMDNNDEEDEEGMYTEEQVMQMAAHQAQRQNMMIAQENDDEADEGEMNLDEDDEEIQVDQVDGHQIVDDEEELEEIDQDMMDNEEDQEIDEGQEMGGEEEGSENMFEIDEEQLRQLQLLIHHQQNQENGDGSQVLCDENGNPIQLNQEDYEAALRHLQAFQAQQMQDEDDEDVDLHRQGDGLEDDDDLEEQEEEQ